MPFTAKTDSLGNRKIPDPDAVDVLLTGGVPTSINREATVRWLGHPPGGEPRLTLGSHSLTSAPTLNIALDVPHAMATSPSELLAGGFGVIFAKLLADQLVRDQTMATELVIEVVLVFSQAGPGRDPALREIRCDLEGRVPGIDEARLAQVGEQAMRRSIAYLAMRTDAISIGLTVSLVGVAPKHPAHGLDVAGVAGSDRDIQNVGGSLSMIQPSVALEGAHRGARIADEQA